jgi:hypothetical protein
MRGDFALAVTPRQSAAGDSIMRSFLFSAPVVLVLAALPSHQARATDPAPASDVQVKADRCEHGVKKSLCTRCNPKLVPVFKAKGDWCNEHGVAESQCVKCNPKLAKEGVK